MPTPRIRLCDKIEAEVKNGTFQIKSKLYEEGIIKNWALIYVKSRQIPDLPYDFFDCMKKCGK